jgi:hypothetical protein
MNNRNVSRGCTQLSEAHPDDDPDMSGDPSFLRVWVLRLIDSTKREMPSQSWWKDTSGLKVIKG